MGSTSSATGVAVGVSVIIVMVLLLGVGGFLYMRRRAGPLSSVEEPDGRRSVVLERSHPASRVTPFGSGNDAPRFDHKPGEAMRFARRREDGGWDFSTPLVIDPFAAAPYEGPTSRCTSPTSSVGAASYYSHKEKPPGELSTRGYMEIDAHGVAPPAYTLRAA